MDCNKKLKLFLDKTREDLSFDATAVRVLDPLDYIPFAVHSGLSVSFIEDESLISITDCLCGRVIQATPQYDKLPFFTKQGSFWTNSFNDDLVEELKKIRIEPRGRCLQEGYKTLLITPIRTGNGCGGNLYFASRQENLLTEKDVDFLENAALKLGEEVFKKMTECDRYNVSVRWMVQSNGEDKKLFARYFEHIKDCPACHDFYSHNLEFDDFILRTLAQPTPPQELQSKIMGGLSHCQRGGE